MENIKQISCVSIGKDNSCLKRGVKHASTTTNFLTFLFFIQLYTLFFPSRFMSSKSVLHISQKNSRNLFKKSSVLMTGDRWRVNISECHKKLTGSLIVLYSFLALVQSITQQKVQFWVLLCWKHKV